MIKTAEELKQQAKNKGIAFYPVHDCSMCGYRCGFIIRDEDVAYDSGCDCVTYTNIQPRTWENLANTYNMNQPENNPQISQAFLDKLNEVWQFTDDRNAEEPKV